jgi:hypothetical protein
MAEANWFWAEGDQRNGPVAPAAIARLVADGKLGPDDLIWKEGMPDWIPVRKVPALMKYAKVPTASAQTPAAVAPVDLNEDTHSSALPDAIATADAIQPVGYYNPSGSMPPRAAATLAKHARPRGDVGDWPLDDARVAQFDEALKLRKKIDSAASLFRGLLLLTAIAAVIIVIAAMVTVSQARGPAAVGMSFGFGIAAVVTIGFTILYYFAWKATARSQGWAPLTMGIIFILSGLMQVFSIVMQSMAISGAAGPAAVGGIIGMLIVGAFAYVAFNAYIAIPKYLLQPAWCQELLSKTGQK